MRRAPLRELDGRVASAWVAVVAVVAFAARSVLARDPMKPDEAGYLLVARTAHRGGRFLYGDLWVDRPPLLIAFYRAADALGGLLTLRVLAAVGVVVLVVAAGWAGWHVASGRGAVGSSVVAAALGCTPLFTAPEVDGEILAAPLVMTSSALTIHVLLGRPRSRVAPLLLLLAGVTGSCAVFVKQNFTDALVFAAVLVLARCVRRQQPWSSGARHLGWVIVGAAFPLAGVLVWASWWHGGFTSGIKALWGPLVAFRSSSLDVISDQSLQAPLSRAVDLFGISTASGLFVLLVAFVVLCVRAVRGVDPLPCAVLAMLVAGQPAIALGGSFWPHYLIQLIPAAALAVALLLREPYGTPRDVAVLASIVTALSCLLAVPFDYPTTRATGCETGAGATTTGGWLATVGHPGDRVAMVYSGATTVLLSGMEPAYPYLWSLPLRTLDPDVSNLRSELIGEPTEKDAAEWVVVSLPLDSWHLDDSGRLSVALVDNYRPVGFVCSRTIWERDDLDRTLPAAP